MTDAMPPSTRSDAALLATARQYAPVGWRPTHQEILQMLAIIDGQAQQLARQPIGYLIAGIGNRDTLDVRGDDGCDSVEVAKLFLAPPAPVEYAHDERVVAVYELPA